MKVQTNKDSPRRELTQGFAKGGVRRRGRLYRGTENKATERGKTMTFKQAYGYAMAHSEAFRKHDAKVKAAQANGTECGCMIFSVEPGETFYYGFDGVDMHKGKHTARRAATLFNRADVLIIL